MGKTNPSTVRHCSRGIRSFSWRIEKSYTLVYNLEKSDQKSEKQEENENGNYQTV